MKVSLNLEAKAVRVLGWDKAIILQYIHDHAEKDGWTTLSSKEHSQDDALCLSTRPMLYYYLKVLHSEGYIRKNSRRFESARYCLSTLGKALFEEEPNG